MSAPLANREDGPPTGVEKQEPGIGLLANGSSGRWDVAIDERLDQSREWSAEIEGPGVYLVFQLQDLKVIASAASFLRWRPSGAVDPSGGRASRDEGPLVLGRFEQAPVALIWDDEYDDRCFLVVGPRTTSLLRLTLQSEDILRLAEALSQAADDLGEDEGD